MSIERLFDRCIPEPNSGCWIWLGSTDTSGYASVRTGEKIRKGHRLSFEAANGPIPDGMHVLHKCDVRCCINPDHLRLGTHTDNMRDMTSKGRHRACLGPKHGLSKLDENAVRSIRDDKRSAPAIAADWNISETHVFRLKNRQAWAHLL